MRRRGAQSVVAVLVALVAFAAAAPATVSAPTVVPRIDLKVLLLGASESQPDLMVWQADLEREGVLFDTITASGGTEITASTLSGTLADGTPEGKYEAIIVASSGIAFASSEWEAIEQYEKTFNIRQVTGNVYPSASYGLNTPIYSGFLDGVSGTLTPAGQAVFPYLKADAPIAMGRVGATTPGTTTWGYEATPINSPTFDTLVSGPGGTAFVGIYTHADGVEELVETYAQNQYLLQDQLLRHGVIAWATRGVYFGDQRNYAETEIDDVFLADDVWDTTTHSTDTDPDHAVQMSPSDVDYAAGWSHVNDFRIDLAFNGSGASDTSGGSSLLSEFTSTDPQTAGPYADSFGWVNHSWDHEKLDQGCASSNFIQAEVNENNNWALFALGLTAATAPGQALGYLDFGALVTGEHSGLANLVPGVPGTVDPPAFNTATPHNSGGTLPAGTYTFAITDQFSTAEGSGESSASQTVVTLGGPGSVTLTWDAVCHAAVYKIYREDMATSTWSLVATIPAPTSEPPNSSFGDPYSTSSVTGGGPLEQTFTDNGAVGTASPGPPATNAAVESPYQQNTQLDAALAALGVGAIAADASKPYPNPADATFANGAPPATQYPAGATFSLQPGAAAQAVPRWPTNIYYNASTEAQEIDEFETLYVLPTCVPSSVTTCYPEGTTFTIDEIVDGVVNDNSGMFTHLMNNDPRPTYFHQSNLIGGSTGLFYSTLNELLSEYTAYFSVPIEQPTLAHAGRLLADQSAWSTNTSVSGYIQGNQVTIANSGAAADVPLTGIMGVGAVYGGTRSGWAGIANGTSTYTAQITWPAPRTMTVQLAPNSILADGVSQSTATVSIANSDGHPIVAEIPTIDSTDAGQTISVVTDNGDGTYTATITGSTSIGSSTITATDAAVAPNTVSAEATLIQTGPASSITLQLSPSSIVADGASKSTATATVTDAQAHPLGGEPVAFASSDPGERIGAVTDHADGTYTATITSSRTVHQVTITATDTSVAPQISAHAVLTQTPAPTTTSTTTTTTTTTQPTTTTSTLDPATPRSSSRIDVVAPKVTIGGQTLAKVKKKVAVKLSCPRNQSYCVGTLSLKAKSRAHKNLPLGKHRFNLAGGSARTVKLAPPKKSLRKLRKAVSTRVAVSAAARNKAGLEKTNRRSMTLYLKLDKKKPLVRIARGPLTYAGGAPVAIQLTCPGSQTYCRGTVSLIARPAAHKALLLGKHRFRIARDVTAVVKVKLSKRAIAKLGKKASVKVKIKATARNRAGLKGTAKRTTLLRLSPTSRGAARWTPPKSLSWYWQLQGTVDSSHGAAAYDIDGFDNSAAEVAKLHAAGKHVICYIDVGTWENWRPDAKKFPSSVLGQSNGWPGERWLDIRQSSVRKLMAARFQMCRQKGFDAIEPDNIDGYQNDTGFPLTAQDQLTYNRWIASKAHALGLAVFQKNDSDQAALLEPYFDGALAEQCNEYKECSAYAPYLRAGKPVLNAEYSLSTGQFCAADNAAGIMGARYGLNLDGSVYEPCWRGNPG